MRIEPVPASRLPDHAYRAPTPRSAPSYERVMPGSTSSHGDHAVHSWKSSISAWTVADRQG